MNCRAGAASRGTLSPRQKQDILFLAGLAKAKGISMEMHGVKVGLQVALEPNAPSKNTTTKTVKRDGGAVREAQAVRLSETDGSNTTPPSKSQQRSVDRLREFQEKVVNAKWLRMANKLGQLAAHLRRSPIHCDFLAARITVRGKMLALMERALAHYVQCTTVAAPTAQAFTTPDQGLDSRPPASIIVSREQVPWHEQLDGEDEFDEEEERQPQMVLTVNGVPHPPSPRPVGTQTLTGARVAPPPAKRKPRGGRSKR